jgi:nucleoid DNA-binding protein
MRIAIYISELLYRYDCVIVPGFGGFITNEISAQVNGTTNTFYPPSKKMTFNRLLKNNDGLLANYIASAEKIAFSDAVNTIEKEVTLLNESLQSETVEIPKIGSFSLNTEGNILFEPSTTENYLTSSFGLTSYNVSSVNSIIYAKKVKELKVLDPAISDGVTRRKTPLFLKYAASAALLFAIGSFTWNSYNENQYQDQLAVEKQQQKEVAQKIQAATFVIANPLPTITLNIEKKVYNYHIIAGAFRDVKNANKKVQQLVDKGFNAQVLGKNKWGLTQVSYASFNSKIEARKELNTIKKSVASDAWLFIQSI